MTQSAAFSDQTFSLLSGLEANNAKQWYDTNRAAFKTHCLDPFGAMLGYVTTRLAGDDLPMIGSDDTMFRMHRDVRFSKDKSPYKTSVSGMLTRSGGKSDMAGMIFVQLDARGGFAAGGFYRLPTKALNQICQKIVDQPDSFTNIKAALSAKDNALSDVDQLTRMPKGFTQHDTHIHAEDIKRKGFVVRRAMTPQDWITGDITANVAALVREAAPLIQFGLSALNSNENSKGPTND